MPRNDLPTVDSIAQMAKKEIAKLEKTEARLRSSIASKIKEESALIARRNNLKNEIIEKHKIADEEIAKKKAEVEEMIKAKREALNQAKAKEGETEVLRQEQEKKNKEADLRLANIRRDEAKLVNNYAAFEEKKKKLEQIKELAESL